MKEAVSTAESKRAVFASMQNRGSRSNVVTAILKASKKGGVLANAGVIGRLGDLATIAPEYDVAIRYDKLHFLIFSDFVFPIEEYSYVHYNSLFYYEFNNYYFLVPLVEV